MKSIYINPATNDIDFDGSNNLKMIDGDDEIIQCVKMIIKTNLGEWFLNPDHGFRRAVVQGKHVDYNEAIEELYAAVLQEPRVAAVEDMQFRYDAAIRELTIDFAFRKHSGEVLTGRVTA